jgi:hypothetical protein
MVILLPLPLLYLLLDMYMELRQDRTLRLAVQLHRNLLLLLLLLLQVVPALHLPSDYFLSSLVSSSPLPNQSPANQIIDSYQRIESFLHHKLTLTDLWLSNHAQNTAFDHSGAIDSICNMDIVCRGDAPLYDPNFRQRGLNGDIVSNFRQLYDCGLTVKSTFDNVLNKIAKSLHMKSYSWDGYSQEIDEVGLILCPMKPAERATQKIQEKCQKIEPGPPESWLYDLVRASFVCDSEHQMNEVCEALQRNYSSIFEIIQIYNHFSTPYPSGYRNIVLNIRVKVKNKQGHEINFICEVVIHHIQLRRYFVQQKVSEDCYHLSSLFITEERIGHTTLQRNDLMFQILEKCIIEISQVKFETSRGGAGEDGNPPLKEDFIIIQCLVAVAEVKYQELQSAPPIFSHLSPVPGNTSPSPHPMPTGEDVDDEELLIRSWVEVLTFFHEYDWAEKYQRLLLIRHLVPKYSEDHAEVADALNKLASIINYEGKYSLSIQLYEKSIYVKTRIYGERHGLVADTLYTMAEVMAGQGKYAMALPLHEQVRGGENPFLT